MSEKEFEKMLIEKYNIQYQDSRMKNPYFFTKDNGEVIGMGFTKKEILRVAEMLYNNLMNEVIKIANKKENK